ncbi:hypothetical protein ABW286_22060 [Erwinia papayae]|uniref:Uncharacterized protein n=1 Tax=Erwinia papayae TaxID=206499 RepID=A0ABV3N7N2_9GAMM
MHGLNIRIEWGKAKVMRVIDESQADYEKAEVLWEAELLGHNDYYDRKYPPHIFLDEPELVKAWRKGWNFHAECEAMSTCDGCNDPNGYPCPYHDMD